MKKSCFGYRKQSARGGFALPVNRSYLHALFCFGVEESPQATLPSKTLQPVSCAQAVLWRAMHLFLALCSN